MSNKPTKRHRAKNNNNTNRNRVMPWSKAGRGYTEVDLLRTMMGGGGGGGVSTFLLYARHEVIFQNDWKHPSESCGRVYEEYNIAIVLKHTHRSVHHVG